MGDPDGRFQQLCQKLASLAGTTPEDPMFVGKRQLDGMLTALVRVEERLNAAEHARGELEHQVGDLSTRLRELERSNAALEQFAFMASHELEEPLRMVTSYTELLEKKYGAALGDDGKRYVFYAADGARRMRQLIHDLLRYARVGRALVRQPVDLTQVADDVLNDLAVSIVESGARVSFATLPTVSGDRDQLASLLRNLLTNAIKYRSSAPPEITVTVAKEQDGWLFSVQDNGIGIDPRHHERIFNIFQRLHAKDQHAGSGIGLALCKRIVEAHGGRIGVTSREGAGARFWFTLPASSSREAREL